MIVRLEDVAANKENFIKNLHKFLDIEYMKIDDTKCPYYMPFGPVRIGIWKKEFPDMMSQLSDEFIYHLKIFDYL